MKNNIYLDNNATTELDPRVLDAVVDVLTNHYGNPSSMHSLGQKGRSLVTKARHTIASYLGVRPAEIIFTSGGTEAVNLVLRGLFHKPEGHLITSSVEHSCVYETAKELEASGVEVTFLEPDPTGVISSEMIQNAIRSNTRLISLMAVNNETGVMTDLSAIAQVGREHHIPVFVDAVALMGKEVFDIPEGISAMCFSGHKFHAPKGVGFLYLSRKLKIHPQLTGGGQENGKRCGTENLPGIIGMAKAVEILSSELPGASEKMRRLRDRLENSLLQQFSGKVTVNGAEPRVCNTTNLSFSGMEGEVLLARLDMEGVAVSHGSACSSGALEPSRVLLNMGVSMAQAHASIRFSLSRFTTEEEIDQCVAVLKKLAS